MSLLAWLVATVAMFSGALVQGSIGFGLNMVAAPILVLLDPHFVPVPVIMVAFVLNCLLVPRHRHPHTWSTMRWPMIGALPAMVAGAAAVAVVSTRVLSIAFGVILLAAVALTASGRRLTHSTRNLVLAGGISGFMGTTTGVGGPPMALLFAHHPGPQLRASLLRFFLFTSVMALVLLAIFGQIRTSDLGLTARLLPGALAGYLVAPKVTQALDKGYVRHAVLVVCTVSAVLVLVKAL